MVEGEVTQYDTDRGGSIERVLGGGHGGDVQAVHSEVGGSGAERGVGGVDRGPGELQTGDKGANRGRLGGFIDLGA